MVRKTEDRKIEDRMLMDAVIVALVIVAQALVGLAPVLGLVFSRPLETFDVVRMVLGRAALKVPAHRCAKVIAAVPKPARRVVRWDLAVAQRVVVVTMSDAVRKVAAKKATGMAQKDVGLRGEVRKDVDPMPVLRLAVRWDLARVAVPKVAVRKKVTVVLKLVRPAVQVAQIVVPKVVALKAVVLTVIDAVQKQVVADAVLAALAQVAVPKVEVPMAIVGRLEAMTMSRSNCQAELAMILAELLLADVQQLLLQASFDV